MDGLAFDLRCALRSLAARPGFAGLVVLALGLGIGAATAIFSVVDAVLLRPAPVADLDRLAMVWQTDRDSGTQREPASVPDFLDFRDRGRSFDALGALAGREVNLTADAAEPLRLAGLAVTHDLLPLLGLAPVAGRQLSAADDGPGAPAVALISESLWERSFGRDPAVVGETLALDERPTTVVGVVPDVSDFGVLQILSAAAYSRSFADRGSHARVDVWLPLQPSAEASRDTHPIFVLGRLAPGATLAAAREEMARIAADLEREYPSSNAARGASVEALAEVVFGPSRPALLLLLAAVGLLLLVATVDVAHLVLARGAARAREVAVRAALGAGGTRLARQLLLEHLVLAVVAGTAGVALAFAVLHGLVALAPPDVPRLAAVALDLRALAVAAGVSLLAGLGFGLVPTGQALRLDLRAALGGGRSSAGRDQRRLRSALVVAEVAVTAVLAISAGLLVHSFWKLRRVDPGFAAGGVLKAEFQLPAARYPADFRLWPDFREMHGFHDALLRRAAALPGVESAAVAGNHPLDPGFTNSFAIVGREAEGAAWPEISVRRVTPGYFRTVGLEVREGRSFRESDGTRAPAVALVNEAAARRFFAGREPLGAAFRMWGRERTVVGVVADERIHGLAEPAPIALYLPLAQAPSANGAGVLLVRTPGDPAALASAVRSAVREIDPALAVFGVEPVAATVARSVSRPRFVMLVLILFGLTALALAAVGIHGVLAYAVERRSREIGIRLALGERPGEVRRRIVREGLGMAALGLVLGLGAALLTSRLLASLLHEVSANDPATFASVAAFLLAVALSATWLPARRATRVDPIAALRAE